MPVQIDTVQIAEECQYDCDEEIRDIVLKYKKTRL